MSFLHRTAALDDDQRGALPEILGPLDRLDEDERDVHADLVARLLARPDWMAARGFELTPDMRLVIAATAALLGVGIADRDPFGNVRGIVVHPSTMVDRQPRPTPMRGVVTTAPRVMVGHTSSNGPVFVSWQAVTRDRRSGRGSVILHEFAHKLDAATRLMDGTPRLDDDREVARWAEVCTRVYRSLVAGHVDPVLRPYGATNPTEFFAVATEAFFTRPLDLRHVHPDLYEVFAHGFRQDPADVDEGRGRVSDIQAREQTARDDAARPDAATTLDD